MATLLRADLPPDPDTRMARLTLGHLLSMQAGLERQSGPNYGAWVASRNWVRAALAAPFVADPGAGMLYSTASTHLVSAMLTRAAGRSTLALAREIAAGLASPEGYRSFAERVQETKRDLLRFLMEAKEAGKTVVGYGAPAKATKPPP